MGNEKLITLVNGREDFSEVELLCAFELDEFILSLKSLSKLFSSTTNFSS